MTENDYKQIKSVLKPFIDGGLISADCIEEIKKLTVKNDNKEPSNKLTSDWLTRQEAADYLKVSKMTVIRLGQEGKIRFKKLDGKRLTRYKLSDIKAFENAE